MLPRVTQPTATRPRSARYARLILAAALAWLVGSSASSAWAQAEPNQTDSAQAEPDQTDSAQSAPASTPPAVAERLEKHVRFLAADAMQGRANGSDQARRARDYIVEEFKSAGLEPAGADGYVTHLEAVVHAEPSRSVSLQLGDHVLAPGVEFAPASISDGGAIAAPAVFAGYGLSAPSLDYDDYAGVDVRGKVVVCLSGAPSGHRRALEADGRGYLVSAPSKAAVALAHGARAILVVNDPRGHGPRPDQQPDRLPRLRPASALVGIGVARLTKRAALRVAGEAGVDLAALQRQIDQSGAPQSRPLDLDVHADFSLDRQTATLDNIAARLPGTAHAPDAPIVVTAHYDGLGYGEAGSLSDHLPALHPGADDNATGVAVLIELARALAADPPAEHPPIIFATPAGEELGLRGSRRMARRLVEAYGPGTVVNFDMLGRLRDQRLHVGLADPSAQRAIDHTPAGPLDVQTEALGEHFSDFVSFRDLGFRALNVTTGRHADYHMPGDTLDKLNWPGLTRVRSYIEALLRQLAEPA